MVFVFKYRISDTGKKWYQSIPDRKLFEWFPPPLNSTHPYIGIGIVIFYVFLRVYFIFLTLSI